MNRDQVWTNALQSAAASKAKQNKAKDTEPLTHSVGLG